MVILSATFQWYHNQQHSVIMSLYLQSFYTKLLILTIYQLSSTHSIPLHHSYSQKKMKTFILLSSMLFSNSDTTNTLDYKEKPVVNTPEIEIHPRIYETLRNILSRTPPQLIISSNEIFPYLDVIHSEAFQIGW